MALVVGAAGLTAALAATGPTGVPLPSSMASTGDSITRAFDVNFSHLLADTPQDSWSTGSDPTVDSHYQRILAGHPAISGQAHNFAKTGAKMAALDGQVKAAAAQKVEYLTILMGANDLCAGSVATMTPTATFQAEFSQALSDFFAADPSAHVFVSSIPDIFRLWQTLRNNPVAEATWNLAHICPVMLSVLATGAQRQQVVKQELADNAVLASVCQSYANCRWDGNAVYNFPFTAAHVSSVDYFHPNLVGQNVLAATTWAAGFWADAPAGAR